MILFSFIQVWLPASKGKGLEITGTFARKNKGITMELTFTNKAMQAMAGFAIQFNKNRYDMLQPIQCMLLKFRTF